MYRVELKGKLKVKALRGVTELSEALTDSRVPTKRAKKAAVRDLYVQLPTKGARRKDQERRMFVVLIESDHARLVDVGSAPPHVQDQLVRQLESGMSKSAPTDFAPLTSAEEDVLREGGLDLTDRSPSDYDPIAQGQAEYRRLLNTALSTAEAAKFLRVNESRIRQRLNEKPRTLYGVRVGRAWKLPRFQFTQDGVVRGFAQVLAQVPYDVHPLSFETWFTTKNPDLLSEDGRHELSPQEWLALGNVPSEVAELARDL
jgi:hypothetical protein